MTPVLVFDIETVPDTAGIRRLSGLPAELDDAAVRDWFAQQRRAATGGDFPPHYLHKVVAIGCALRTAGDLKVSPTRSPSSSAASSTGSSASRRSWCRGTAAASTCRCSTTAR